MPLAPQAAWQVPLPLVRLKTRKQFLRLAAKGNKLVRPTLIAQSMPLSPSEQGFAKRLARKSHLGSAAYIGFTASKKVGNAPARNRAKRRLTAAVRTLAPNLATPNKAYVFIARSQAVAAPFGQIEADVRAGLTLAGTPKKHEGKRRVR